MTTSEAPAVVPTETPPASAGHDPARAGEPDSYLARIEAASDADRAYAADLTTRLIDVIKAFTAMKHRLFGAAHAEGFDFGLLIRLSKHGPSRASDLAELVCADPSTVSRQVVRWSKSGCWSGEPIRTTGGPRSSCPPTPAARRSPTWSRRAAEMSPRGRRLVRRRPRRTCCFARSYTEGTDSRRHDTVKTLSTTYSVTEPTEGNPDDHRRHRGTGRAGRRRRPHPQADQVDPVGLMAGMFLAALDQTIVSTSIRTIADDLQRPDRAGLGRPPRT